MTKIDYSAVQILLAIENKAVRVGLREAFKNSGFNAFLEAGDQKSFQTAIETASFDLIVMAAELGGFFVAPVVAAMRNGLAPHHPFPLVLMLLANGDKELVHKVIDSGPDDVMMMPVAPGPILSRIEGYAVRRRPFVVTMAYVGPDRRVNGPRPGSKPAPLIDVPNPIRSAIRKIPEAERQSEIHFTRIHLNALMLECYAGQLRWLDGTIRQMLGQDDIDKAKLLSFAGGMKKIAEDLPRRVRMELSPRISDLLHGLKQNAEEIMRNGGDFETILDNFASLTAAIGEILNPAAEIPAPADDECLPA